jgi:putative FmdB family regulatory protein
MPTYSHICISETCLNEWDDFYSIVADPPTTCPKCGQATAQRVISGGSGRGIVELTGHDLTAKVKEDTAKLKQEMHSDENTYANMTGHDTYQKLQQKLDEGKRYRR